MSFNIRNSAARDGRNNWAVRRQAVGRLLCKYSPDIIGFQEVLADQLKDLATLLPDYRHAGVGRDDGRAGGEFAPLFFRGLQPSDSETFWLSDTPEIPGCTWGGQNRICTRVSFTGPQRFAVFNTHLENAVEKARIKSIRLIAERLSAHTPNGPVFLIGDLNFKQGSREYRILAVSMRDSYREDPAGRPWFVTSHSFSGRTVNRFWRFWGEGRIDYIWIKGDARVVRSRILQEQPEPGPALYPSDHWPLLCEVSF